MTTSPPDLSPDAPESIAAVIVTRNRLALLQESVAAVRAQARAPQEIIVIDNASDDGTREWLEQQSGLVVIRQGNLGGAGGFHRGIKEAHARGHAWIWCMDDDTIPAPECLGCLCATPAFEDPSTGFLASLVQWTDGTPHKMNMWLDVPGGAREARWMGSVLSDGCLPTVTSSFVSVLIARRAVEAVGLPLKEMFIWCDDAEYTRRISSRFRGYYVLSSVAIHKTAANKDGALGSITPPEYFKLSYGLRNEVYLRRTQSQPPLIKALQLALLLARQSARLLQSRAPLYLLRSLWSGLLFSPRIERVRPLAPGGESAKRRS